MTVGETQLRRGFEQFVAVARELETGYRDLKARVASVDLELQETNAALQQSLDEREAVFAAMPIGLVTVRDDGSTRICNQEAERLCALADAADLDLVGHATGEVAIGEGVVRVRRVALPDGELVMLEDRSRLRELEREVDRLDRLAGLSELALGIAHEIKNPLNGVAGFAALLERSEDPEASRRFAGKVVAGVRQVDDIVKSMLGFSRPDRGRARMLTLTEIVGDAISAAGLPSKSVEVTGRREARADADALVRVLGNLLRNAVEASPDVHVRVHVELRAGWLEILVEDDGPGVDADLGRRVLEPMVSSKDRGTGLGLSLSSRVLAFLGGELQLQNPGEPGARFLVRLPAAKGGSEEIAAEASS